MNYKREEPFRYEFTPPLPCSFNIIEIGELQVNTSIGDGKLLDLSQKGLKLESNLQIPVSALDIKIKLQFKINVDLIIADGYLVWSRHVKESIYHYGIKFINASTISDVIIDELKVYSKHKY